MYQFYIQKFMPFAAAFANGFVLEKRTHFGGVYGGDSCALIPKTTASGPLALQSGAWHG
jgi:hypothetical protein